MGRISDLSTREHPKVPKNAFFGNGQKSQVVPFEDQISDFADAPPPPCAVRWSWKLIWELFRARQSPQKIFSSNGLHTAEVEPSPNRQNRLFSKILKNRQKTKSAQKWRFFDQNRKISHRCLSQLILTISVNFEQFVFSFNFFDPNRHFWGLFSLSRYQSFLAILGSS